MQADKHERKCGESLRKSVSNAKLNKVIVVFPPMSDC